MKTRYLRLILLLAPLSLLACASTGEPDAKQRYATLVTLQAPAASRAYQVEISRIDNRYLNLGDFDPEYNRFSNGRVTHRIKPGTHRVDGIPIIRPHDISPIGIRNRQVLPLVHNFESGTKYYLAVRPSEVDRRKLEVFIWKQEESKQGLLDLD